MKSVKSSFTIHDLPVSERPRERLQKFGAGQMSVQELLCIVLGRGIAGESVTVTAQNLITKFGDIKGISDASIEELKQVKGIGLAKASQIQAVFELGRRARSLHYSDSKLPVKTPEEVCDLVADELMDHKKEHFLALLLDTRSRLIKNARISVGTLDSSIVHPREVFKEAVAASACSVIFVHNHPSGDPKPSEEDIKLTRRLVEAGDLMGITVIDHVIIGNKNFFSLKREGLL